EEIGARRIDVYGGRIPLRREGRPLGVLELAIAYPDELGETGRTDDDLARVFTNLSASEEFLRFARDIPHRIDRYRGEELVASTNPQGGLGTRIHPRIVRALADPQVPGRWVDRQIGGHLWDLYCVRERDGNLTVGYLTFGIERPRAWDVAAFIARAALVTLVLTAGLLAALMFGSWALPRGAVPHRVDVPRPGFRERVIGGFLVVSLVPTVLLGLAGRSLFVQEKREEFEERLGEDLRVSRELLGRRLSDAARNAAGADEVAALFAPGRSDDYRTLSTPASVDGIVVTSAGGQLLGASPAADLDMALLPTAFESKDTPLEFFRRRGDAVFACAVVPVAPPEAGGPSPGAVLAFQRVDEVLAAELERRVGSCVSFFAGGQLAATSRPELYQSEILSDLVESEAYQKIELEGAQRTLQEIRVGQTAFLSSCAPLPDPRGEPAAMVAAIAPFLGGGLDLDASLVLSRIYFLCLLVLTAAIAAAFVLANRLTRPISELTAGAERIGRGTLGGRIRSRATGEIGRLVRSFNEMSEQLAESEARDRERREYIEAIIRHVGSGVVSFDAEDRVATVNEAAARILEVDPAVLLGARPDEVRGTAALDAVLRAVAPVLEGRRSEVVAEIEVESDGDSADELRTFRLVATPLVGPDGQAQGAVAVFEDLSDLIKSKKITAWAEMARQVAHEIKNPLTPMKLSAQHLRQAWRDRHPRFDRILEESTETIVDRCEALRRIAIEFSDYARMPGRRIRREDLGRLLGEARRLYGEADDRQVAFRLEAPEDQLYARVDKDEVMRLFINLIENSIQAMPAGGDLTVRAHRENGAALVEIHDTGVGITTENLRRIFEPSFST
ncbi:MAG TPA: HAMP domain-containing protein, partial [bacterium]|nr:HAMP domain-containing protein [bacterium]